MIEMRHLSETNSTLKIGSTFTGFLENVVSSTARESIRESALRVLGAALAAGDGSVGLIVGRIQSGKTLSYESVIALARDNDFALVIVISGISTTLLDQGEGRLKEDLLRADQHGWNFLSPSDQSLPKDYIESELTRIQENWSDQSTPIAYKQTGVVFLLKHHGRINDLAEVLARVKFGELRVLIIDDEADQASLNTQARKARESTTFARIRSLRDAVPNHMYLQYTATPQAPLLVAIQSALSPDYVRVLSPGTGYTGGGAYFIEPNNLVETISETDLAMVEDPDGPPPPSLLYALRQFLIGAAHVAASGDPETRSMIVHPSREKHGHAVFAFWVRDAIRNWHDKIAFSGGDEPIKLKSEFRAAWTELKSTFPGLLDFGACWSSLGLVFRNLDITEVNTSGGSKTPIIRWTATKAYILIGGQALDRGFTVEGLTVTYMPRGAGMSVADTVQQRARFFGYKASYLGLCRVYLAPEVRSELEMYVHHEREMIQTLRNIEEGIDSLKLWKRRFLLDPSMKPTRRIVIGIETTRVKTIDRWVVDRYPVRDDALSLVEARMIASQLFDTVRWELDDFGNKVGTISVLKALELLESITPESFLGEEGPKALQFALARLADEENANASVAVIWIRPDRVGVRTEALDDEAVQIFQGRSPSNEKYPGDTKIYSTDRRLTVQLHQVQVQAAETGAVRGEFLLTAWRIQENAFSSWIVQN